MWKSYTFISCFTTSHGRPLQAFVYPPLDMPLSISELALLPRRPVLLRLCPSLLPLRISLFRVMTGVSANGSIMRFAFGSRSFAALTSCWFGVCAPANACVACSSGAGVTCFCFFFCGSDGVFLLVRLGKSGSTDFGRISRPFLSLEMRAERRRFCVSDDSGSTVAIDFFRRAVALTGAGSGEEGKTVLRRVGFATLSSGMLSCSGAACALVLRVVRRENWKPSSFSSYATFAVFLVVVAVAAAAFLLVPFRSALTLFGAGASSSSKARFALCRRVLGRFVAIGRDASGERAKMVDIESAAVKVNWCCGCAEVASKRVHERRKPGPVEHR